jgi:hypothetical protein
VPDILERQLHYAANDSDNFLDAAQNARLIASAERYYRVMYFGGAESWICGIPICSTRYLETPPYNSNGSDDAGSRKRALQDMDLHCFHPVFLR